MPTLMGMSTREIHRLAVAEVVKVLERTYRETDASRLSPGSFAVDTVRAIDVANGLMPRDIVLMARTQPTMTASLKIHGVGDGPTHTSAWRALAYAVEATALPDQAVYLQVITHPDPQRLLERFPTTNKFLADAATSPGQGMSVVCRLSQFVSGEWLELADRGIYLQA
jgi:hypothetical protein